MLGDGRLWLLAPGDRGKGGEKGLIKDFEGRASRI